MRFLVLMMTLFGAIHADIPPKTLYDGNCVTCHEIDKTVSAPSTRLIQESYKRRFKDKQSFVDFMVKWIQEPNEESAIMKESIKRHELMPKIPYDPEVLRKIAEYLYDSDFTK